jgi:hypothetical protein
MSSIRVEQSRQNDFVSAVEGEERAVPPLDHAHDGSGDITKCPMHHLFD